MDPLLSLLADGLPLVVLVLGLLLAGVGNFGIYPLSERKWCARIGIALIVLGVCGMIWPFFILVYLLLTIVGLVAFAARGIYRSFG